MENPLALYVFSGDDHSCQTVIDNTLSGGVTVNDVLMHAAIPNAPFGGVGESGSGYYHGKYGIFAFSHLRTIVSLPTWLDRYMEWRYPPYNIANVSKFSVGKPRFRRGETIEDQKIKSIRGTRILWKMLPFVATAAIAVLAERRGLFRW